MKINKKKVFRIHSWIGIKLSILFFVVCFTGTLATLSDEMDWLFMSGMRAEPSEQLAPLNVMAANVNKAWPNGRFTGLSSGEESYLCSTAYVIQDGVRWFVFVNPYTGAVQGATTLTFYRFFRDLHYYLFIPFQIGHFTVLMFAFLLLISLVTALLFYKKWYKKLFELKRGNGRMVFYRSLHRLIGVWSVPFMIVFSITGIWYFLERTDTANISKVANTRTPKLEVNVSDSTYMANLSTMFDYDRAVMAAQKAIPGLTVNSISLPSSNSRPVYITGKSHVLLVRDRANRVYVHPESYEVIQVQNADEIGTVTYLNDIADPLHFGDWGGLATKIIWFVGGLGISALILTGLWIAFKRKVRDRDLQRAQRMGAFKYINWGFLLAFLGYMFHTLYVKYEATTIVFYVVAIGVLICIALGWYLFDYKIKQSLRREGLKKS
jgi:uncharacterized iron-regulated membrane protein